MIEYPIWKKEDNVNYRWIRFENANLESFEIVINVDLF